jgi:hypothetical protein
LILQHGQKNNDNEVINNLGAADVSLGVAGAKIFHNRWSEFFLQTHAEYFFGNCTGEARAPQPCTSVNFVSLFVHAVP